MARKIDNPDKEHKDIKIVIKDNKAKLEELPLTELLAYRDAVEILFSHYDNLAKANTGMYDDYKKEDYAVAMRMAKKYQDLGMLVFEVIKEKVDNI